MVINVMQFRRRVRERDESSYSALGVLSTLLGGLRS
jgi:hypothetical protein